MSSTLTQTLLTALAVGATLAGYVALVQWIPKLPNRPVDLASRSRLREDAHLHRRRHRGCDACLRYQHDRRGRAIDADPTLVVERNAHEQSELTRDENIGVHEA
ncbi:hypothetical protein DCE94_03920 [Agromyces badenianii]|nr:hypothetical protein DCE94_03920 [Agromyces badenianii]